MVQKMGNRGNLSHKLKQEVTKKFSDDEMMLKVLCQTELPEKTAVEDGKQEAKGFLFIKYSNIHGNLLTRIKNTLFVLYYEYTFLNIFTQSALSL